MLAAIVIAVFFVLSGISYLGSAVIDAFFGSAGEVAKHYPGRTCFDRNDRKKPWLTQRDDRAWVCSAPGCGKTYGPDDWS